ncbi:winged helix-turn-helix domain-containing protein [Streptomyces sp. V2I9]|uniref:helix-turn-helix domain-containing protein n=1 Tax=Streptomyces sp. V2I9 TaxID=3042304 RepID=UPI00277F7FB0|nr:winged helix-turn-helix domain-containing protein [Streptomyces sp. V2I9]MDQ0987939.1 hypothetical protein [Streptomyces sp. V2I9]
MLVVRRSHVRFSQPQLSRILHQMAFSVQVPVHRAAEHDDEKVEVWRRETWPDVERR